uniref:Uncharacterized protein n=1 Tax=Anguilla anguilla TaxID=7936 RepID=A0A0E9Q8D0_ANGAN
MNVLDEDLEQQTVA